MLPHTALFCLALTIYHEARGEPYRGQIEVAQVVINRVRSKQFPNTVCGVVHQRGQFSWVTQVKNPKPKNLKAWNEALSLSDAVLLNPDAVLPGDKSLFYHERRVHPIWDRDMRLVKQIGQHRFYAEVK